MAPPTLAGATTTPTSMSTAPSSTSTTLKPPPTTSSTTKTTTNSPTTPSPMDNTTQNGTFSEQTTQPPISPSSSSTFSSSMSTPASSTHANGGSELTTGMLIGIIVGGCAFILALSVAVIFLIYWLKRKRKRNRISAQSVVQTLSAHKRQSSPNDDVRFRPDISRPQHLDFSVAESDSTGTVSKKPSTSRKIRLYEYQERVVQMHREHDFMFQAEFDRLNEISDTLPQDRSELTATQECNMAKNRFADVLPYEDTRVKLETEGSDNTDFINASFIDGYNRPREYIACQGPISELEEKQGRRKATVNDYWLMIWQQNVRCIVMLTQIVENFRYKCGQYWPEEVNSSAIYGNIKVTLQNEIYKGQLCTMRTFLVERNEESHKVHQWHFKEWEDTKGLVEAKYLLNFIEQIQNSPLTMGSNAAPSVIHCSAGVGRTGTYIALDILLQHIRQNDFADILGCVYALRKQRVRMVQTLEQYILIYDCLGISIGKKLSEDDRDSKEDGFLKSLSVDEGTGANDIEMNAIRNSDVA